MHALSSPSPAKRTVLLVEDDEAIREAVQSILELEGYTVLCAVNGADALVQAEQLEKPCLILLDLMMPVMDGWEFLRRRRKLDAIAALPVVVVSAAADREAADNSNAVVRKPPDLDTLLKTVERYCGSTGTPSQAA